MWTLALCIGLLMFLVYKKVSILIVAPLCAVLLLVLNGMAILPSMTDTFMVGFSGFVKSYFLIFLVSTLFGKVMEDTGAAASIARMIANALGAKNAVYGVVLATAVLTYGGVATFVVVFAILPIAIALFKEANITKRLIPGAIAAGSFTFAAAMFPGTPQVINMVPVPLLKTNAMAGAGIGISAGLLAIVLIILYFKYEIKNARNKGLVFESSSEVDTKVETKDLPNPWISLLPIIAVIVTLNVFKLNVIIAMLIGIVLCTILLFKRLADPMKTFNIGVAGTAAALINTSAVMGFGAVAKATPAFATLLEMVL